MLLYFTFFLKKDNNIIKNFFISFFFFLLICLPHIIWLFNNEFSTIKYAFLRTGVESKQWFHHLYNPLIFITKQFGMMLVFFLTFFFYLFIYQKNSHFQKN